MSPGVANQYGAEGLLTTLTIPQIDARIVALHQHMREAHDGHKIVVTPAQCRDRIDKLLLLRFDLQGDA